MQNKRHYTRTTLTHNLPKIDEISEKTAKIWLSLGTITVASVGSENTYYVDQFGMEYYCKNYPQ